MLELQRVLADRLKQSRVRIDVPDGNTVFFRNVPANERFFNKGRTNLLVKRPQPGMPFLVCVDEDLEYCGPDDGLTRAFAAGHTQQGWRVLSLRQADADFARVVERALAALGFDGGDPAVDLPVAPGAADSGSAGGVLNAFGANLTALARDGSAEPTVARSEETAAVLGCLLQQAVRLPLIVGASGVGKSNLLHGVARALLDRGSPLRVVAVDLGRLLAGTIFDAERENLLETALKEAAGSSQTVVALDHLELALAEAPHGPWLLARALDQGARIVGTTLPQHRGRFEGAPLARRIHAVELVEPGTAEATAMLLAARDRLARHHRVRIDDSLGRAAVEASLTLAGRFPAKAMLLLDAAATRAALSGAGEVALHDILLAANALPDAE